jgi:antitoxin HicB
MNPHTGSDFDEFLRSEGILGEVEARAHKKLLALQLQEAMQAAKLNKTQLAEQLQTSRSQIDRLLDPDYTALTLESLERLAHALGKQLRIELA